MSYKKASAILPPEVVALIQNYIDGAYIYIPRKESQRKSWGASTNFRGEMMQRNEQIYHEYCQGIKVAELAARYCLSSKSIYRIILKQKNV